MNERHDDLQEIIDAALREMAAEEGDGFDPQACNLAEFCRRTGLTRSRARTVRAHGFRALPHGNSGRRAAPGVLAGHTGLVDDLLRKGVTNSQVIFERLLGQGYAGGLTTVKTYIAAHRDLVPAKRRQAAPQGCRGQRFRTAPGEAYQMDWGFVAVERPGGERARIACFAMVCHHCGGAHVEFFPNARQENLLIGMLHAFSALGVPATVLTDNMKSVVVRRDADGRPVWQADYAEFMGVVGFRTRLCRPRHPYTKGKVERLVRFVKGNFLAGRSFTDLDALNREAALWCAEQGGRWRRAAACVPMREHEAACSANTRPLEVTAEVERYLCPRRKIFFDGFVSFEGHRYGVPYWYVRRECRVNREGRVVHIYSDDLSRELVAHAVGTGADRLTGSQTDLVGAQSNLDILTGLAAKLAEAQQREQDAVKAVNDTKAALDAAKADAIAAESLVSAAEQAKAQADAKLSKLNSIDAGAAIASGHDANADDALNALFAAAVEARAKVAPAKAILDEKQAAVDGLQPDYDAALAAYESAKSDRIAVEQKLSDEIARQEAEEVAKQQAAYTPKHLAGTDTAQPGSLAQTGDRAELIGETFVIGGTVLVAAGVFLDQKKRREQM